VGRLGLSWGCFDAVLRRLGLSRGIITLGHVGQSWGRFCMSWGRLGTVLRLSWAVLGLFWGCLGPILGCLEPSWAVLHRLGDVLGLFGVTRIVSTEDFLI